MTNQKMFFDEKIARLFATHEENYKHIGVADAIARVLIFKLQEMPKPWHIADLGAGAHIDRYDPLFEIMLAEPRGKYDHIDISPVMISLAKETAKNKFIENRLEIVEFFEIEAIEYLKSEPDSSLDGIIMKYTFEDIHDIDELFGLVSQKLKKGGVLVATMQPSDVIPSSKSNARFLYRGEEFPEAETRTLADGEEWGIKFFNKTGEPDSGYLEGGETTKVYHSPDKITELAKKHVLEHYMGNWKDAVPREQQGGNGLDQTILLLEKK